MFEFTTLHSLAVPPAAMKYLSLVAEEHQLNKPDLSSSAMRSRKAFDLLCRMWEELVCCVQCFHSNNFT